LKCNRINDANVENPMVCMEILKERSRKTICTKIVKDTRNAQFNVVLIA
jgi:hypothetical protein